jgi:ABC-type glycerol-3-phosphate transport system permease component
MRTIVRPLAITLASALLSAMVLLPLYWMFVTSIQPAAAIVAAPPQLWPSSPTVGHYARLFTETEFVGYVRNSAIVALIVVVIVDVAAFAGGYVLSRAQSWLSRATGGLALVSYMIAPIMIVIPLYMVLRATGLIDTYAGLALAHVSFCLPFAIWLMKAYIDDVPLALEMAARVDGASTPRVLWSIVLPLSRPGLAAVSIFTFILSWNDYVFARVLASGARKTIPVGLDDIYGSTITDWGLLMAAGVVATIPVLAGFVAINRTLLRGWTHSGLKG